MNKRMLAILLKLTKYNIIQLPDIFLDYFDVLDEFRVYGCVVVDQYILFFQFDHKYTILCDRSIYSSFICSCYIHYFVISTQRITNF